MSVLRNYIEDFFSLLYPDLCAGCKTNLFKSEHVVCTSCKYHLPYTNFHLDTHNKASRQLLGRFDFNAVASYLYFTKSSRVQNIMHQLKYNNRPETGSKMGEMYGDVLKNSTIFNSADLIVPVPLHPDRLKKRGYNQSEFFAKGLAKSMNIPVGNELKRKISTESQTKKSRFSRYENMKDVFYVAEPEKIAGKHILLVDDVLTTGATIEACALQLLKMPQTTISIATIAFTE